MKSHALALRYPDRRFESRFERELEAVVDPVLARFGAWYELFPRSAARKRGTARHARAIASAPAAVRFATGLRRALPAADPSDRPRPPQGPEQRARSAPGRSWQPVGDRGERRRPHGTFIPPSARWKTSAVSWRAPGSIGLEIALDIAFQCSPDHPYVERASGVVPAAGRTARCSTPRTRRRNTRTSIPSISRPRTGPRCGRSCATSSSSGSGRACASSASTIRTPSRSRSGSG